MDFKTLFFSWHGRSARKPYWIGIVTVTLGIVVTSFVISFVMTINGVKPVGVAVIVPLLFAYPRICVVTKRFHDFGRSGWWQVIPNIAVNALSRVEGSATMMLLAGLLEIGFLIWLGCMRGEERANDFGPAPGVQKAVEVF